jgi:hypothetical protein
LGRRKKDNPKYKEDGFVTTNLDTGMQIVDGSKCLNDYHLTNDITMFSDAIMFAFKYGIVVNISEWWLDNAKDISDGKIYIENMGFEVSKLLPSMKMYDPWLNDDLYWLKSWTPGANVNKFSSWSDIEHDTPRIQQVEHIRGPFDRFDKYDIDKYFKREDVLEWDADVDERRNWQKNIEEKGVLSTEEGKNLHYEESSGLSIAGKMWKPSIKKIKEAELS